MRSSPPKSEKEIRQNALTLLARREHSRCELRRKLEAKGWQDVQITSLLDELESQGVLSDARFTESYVHHRQQRGFGPERIRMGLRERGIADDLICDYLDAHSEHWLESARVQCDKRFGNQPPKDFRERTRRARFLQNRGFGTAIIMSILDDFA